LYGCGCLIEELAPFQSIEKQNKFQFVDVNFRWVIDGCFL